MSEILNFWLSVSINFTNHASISDVHSCVKVYTSCQFGAFSGVASVNITGRANIRISCFVLLISFEIYCC